VLLKSEHLLQEILEILLSILLLSSLELLVLLPDQSLEHVWLNAILAVVYFTPVFLRLTLKEHLLCYLLLRVSSTHHAIYQLAHLAEEAGRSELSAKQEMLLCVRQVFVDELWESKEHLEH
jgi:hypothetical protein